jgi:minichromosome maintenance protein 10
MKDGERLDGRDGANMNGGGLSGAAGVPSLPPPSASASAEGGTTTAAATTRGDKSPVRKKTRFVTENGIREAGRDSLGEPMLSAAVKTRLRRQVVALDDDDDDDLIIVR